MPKYLINTSFHLLESIAPQFEEWVKTEYLPEIKLSGLFCSPLFVKLLIEVEPGTVSYSVQMCSDNLEVSETWHNGEAARIRHKFFNANADKIHFFTTFMEVIE